MPKELKEELTDTQKTRLFVNVPFSTPEELELREKLETMVKENGSTNAAFIRLLITQEWDRREQAKKVEANLRKKGLWK